MTVRNAPPYAIAFSGAPCVEVNEDRPISSVVKGSAGSADISDVQVVHKFAQ